MRQKLATNNIKLLYLSHLLTGLVFWYGIEKIFMTNIGIDAFGVGIAGALFTILALIFEVPSGAIADRWGRKRTLLVAIACLAISTLIFAFSTTLPVYLLGIVPYVLYVAGTSGTFQAIVYDSLKESGQEKDYARVIGRMYALFLTGQAISAFASGVIAAHFSLQTDFLLTLVPCALNIIVLMLLREPPIRMDEPGEGSKMRQSFALFKTNKQFIHVAGLFVFVGALLSIVREYNQLYYLDLGLGEIMIGVMFGLALLGSVVGRLVAHRLHTRNTPLIIIGVALFAVMALWQHLAALAVVVAFFIVMAIVQNNNDVVIQEAIPSHIRATATSVFSLWSSIVLIPLGLGIGKIAAQASVPVAYQVVLILAVAYLAIWLIVSRRALAPITSSV